MNMDSCRAEICTELSNPHRRTHVFFAFLFITKQQILCCGTSTAYADFLVQCNVGRPALDLLS
jgi:hypothetical protein